MISIKDNIKKCLNTVILFALLLITCSGCWTIDNKTPLANMDYYESQTPFGSGTTDSIGTPIQTPSPTLVTHESQNTSVPTVTTVGATLTSNSTGSDYLRISVTQGPVILSTQNPESEVYLYNQVIVTFITGWDSEIFLNLDNLTDKNPDEGDLLIYINSGTMGTRLEIFPANLAWYYYSGSLFMDEETCAAEFPKTKEKEEEQYGGDVPVYLMATSENAYCFITSEGHMAVVNVLYNSKSTDDKGNLLLPVRVTVYKKTEPEIMVPVFTPTVGGSQTQVLQ